MEEELITILSRNKYKEQTPFPLGEGRGEAPLLKPSCMCTFEIPDAAALARLDAAYAADHLDGYIARLQYSTEDEHNGRPAPEELAFRIDPKDPLYFKRIHEGLNSLRNAVELYRDYRDEG